MSTPRPPLPPMPYRTMNDWRVDDPNWPSNPYQAPLLFLNVGRVESWSGHAVSFGGLEPAWLVLPMVDDFGQANLNPTAGAVQFWFSPYWNSVAAGGTGPGRPVVLFEVGAWSEKSAVGWWSLEVAPDGNSVAFAALGSVESVEVLRAPLVWRAGVWHQVTLNYSAKGTELYLDGVLAAVGPGVELAPLSPSPGRAGFAVGSSALGGHSALGEFDELSTFAEPRPAADIAAHYNALKDRAAMGPVTPEEEAKRAAMVQSLIAAGAGEPPAQMMSFNCELGPALKRPILLGDGTLRLEFDCREAGVIYELAYAPGLTVPIHWQRVAFIRPEQDHYLVSDARATPSSGAYPPSGFYRFGKLPDYYVSAGAAPGGDGSSDLPYQTIQDAIDAAPDGTVIKVLPGVYSGSGNFDLSFGNKQLVLVSERGWEQTTIDCGAVSGSRAFVFDTPIAVKVIGFTIANARNSAVYCGGGSRPLFMNCAFTGNSGTHGGAVHVNQASVALLNCRFWANSASGSGGAVCVQGASGAFGRAEITHATFSNNQRPANMGTIYAADYASVKLENSIVWTTAALGDEIAGSGTVVAECCDIRMASGVYPGPGNLNLNGQGIRSMEWCPNGLLDGQGQPVQRYLIIGGPANGGPLEKEIFGQKYSLHSWTGNGDDPPETLIDDLRPYTTRPEGVDLSLINGQWRVLFVEDRYRATGYGARNAVHWPVSILGNVP